MKTKEENYVDNPQEFTHVELCAGYSGIHLGLERVIRGLRTIAYSEIETFACENLVAKMEAGHLDPAPIWTDLKTFPWASFHGLVDVLSGGYPCQPFSLAGKRLGHEDPRHLWPFIADGIASMRPRLVFFENVEGHISQGLREVIADLAGLGYRVEAPSGDPTWGIFSAEEVGAPHQRKRVFILAVDNSERGQELMRKIAMQQEYPPLWNACLYERIPWPSRPGQAQYQWEPPRVIGGNNVIAGNPEELWRTPGASDGEGGIMEMRDDAAGKGELWQTPKTGDSHATLHHPERLDGGQKNLAFQLEKNWATPRSGKTTDEDPETWQKRKDAGDVATMPLGCQVKAWGTSQVTTNAGSPSPQCTGKGSRIEDQVAEEQWPTPRTPTGGAESAERKQELGRTESGGGDLASKCAGKLNPRWVETLMGLPIGWTRPNCATPSHPLSDRDRAEDITVDNRTDELRMLGNGVLPDTVEKAARTLLARLLT